MKQNWIVAIAALGLGVVSALDAAPLKFTVSGTYGEITNSPPPGMKTTPFDNGSTFSASFILPDVFAFSIEPTRVFMHTDGYGTYTNGSVTLFLTDQHLAVYLSDPTAHLGNTLGFSFSDVYVPGDLLQFFFGG